jgi:hypothetical protein
MEAIGEKQVNKTDALEDGGAIRTIYSFSQSMTLRVPPAGAARGRHDWYNAMKVDDPTFSKR